MNKIAIIAAGVIILYFVFKGVKEYIFRKWFTQQAGKLLTITSVILCDRIMQNLLSNSMREIDKEYLGLLSAACTNYLMGQPKNINHSLLGDDLIKEASQKLLDHNASLQELVVTGLRLKNFGRYLFNKKTDNIVGEEILMEYGRLFPDGPDLAYYRALVEREARDSSEGVRQALINKDLLL